jgi:hypothetical protein
MTDTAAWRVRLGVRRLLACAALGVLVAAAAEGSPHRARMSRDLADRLAGQRREATRVIVSGGPGTYAINYYA